MALVKLSSSWSRHTSRLNKQASKQPAANGLATQAEGFIEFSIQAQDSDWFSGPSGGLRVLTHGEFTQGNITSGIQNQWVLLH